MVAAVAIVGLGVRAGEVMGLVDFRVGPARLWTVPEGRPGPGYFDGAFLDLGEFGGEGLVEDQLLISQPRTLLERASCVSPGWRGL